MEFEPNGTHCYIILQNGIRIGSFHLCDKGQWKLAQGTATMFDFETMKAVTAKHEELVNAVVMEQKCIKDAADPNITAERALELQILGYVTARTVTKEEFNSLTNLVFPKSEEYYQETKVPHPDDA